MFISLIPCIARFQNTSYVNNNSLISIHWQCKLNLNNQLINFCTSFIKINLNFNFKKLINHYSIFSFFFLTVTVPLLFSKTGLPSPPSYVRVFTLMALYSFHFFSFFEYALSFSMLKWDNLQGVHAFLCLWCFMCFILLLIFFSQDFSLLTLKSVDFFHH